MRGGEDITDVKYNGVAMTLVGRDDANWNVAAFKLANPATGANNITITTVAPLYQGGNGTEGWGMSFTGVSQSSPVDTFVAHGNGGSGLANDYTSNITTASANEYVTDVFITYKQGTTLTIAADAGQTEEYNNNAVCTNGYRGGVSYKSAASAGTQTLGWTRTDTAGTQKYVNHLLVALNPASQNSNFFMFMPN